MAAEVVGDGLDASIDQTTNPLDSVALNHEATKEFLKRDGTAIVRHVLYVSEENLPNHLTHGTLANPDMLGTTPFVVTDNAAGSLLAFYHLGGKLAGHAGIVHGGISATILDECMGRACFPRLVGKIAVTAKLELNYKAPVKSNSFILVKATTVKVEGRKAWVEATLEDATDGQLLAQAEGFFIEPKWAASMPKMMADDE